MLAVVRLLQAELGWLAFINELGFGSAMVCITVPRIVCKKTRLNYDRERVGLRSH